MGTITIAGRAYTTQRLNALKQFHVARRIAPALAVMGVTAAALARLSDASKDDDAPQVRDAMRDFLPVLGPLTDVVSKMPEDDVNYVLFTCLSACTVAVGDRQAPVVVPGSQLSEFHLMDENAMDMPTMLRLVVEVVRDNMAGFMKGLGEGAAPPSP